MVLSKAVRSDTIRFLLLGGEAERAEEAGRPGGGEEIFGGRVRFGKLDVEHAVGAARIAFGAAFDVGGAGEESLVSHFRTPFWI